SMLMCRLFTDASVSAEEDPGDFWQRFFGDFEQVAEFVRTALTAAFAEHPWWGALASLALGLSAGVLVYRLLQTLAASRYGWGCIGVAILAGAACASFFLWCPMLPGNEWWWRRSVACGAVVSMVFGVAALCLPLAALLRLLWHGGPWHGLSALRSLAGTVVG